MCRLRLESRHAVRKQGRAVVMQRLQGAGRLGEGPVRPVAEGENMPKKSVCLKCGGKASQHKRATHKFVYDMWDYAWLQRRRGRVLDNSALEKEYAAYLAASGMA